MMFKNLYTYRELLKTNVKKEIRGKYKGSLLGVLWSFINPLLQVTVYAIVFPYLMRGNTIDNYLLYLVTGIIPWTFFTGSITQGMSVVKANAGIIKKVYFPREILPISVILSGLVNFFISCIIILAFCIGTGVGLSWTLIFIPIIAFIQALLSLGIVFILSAINVYLQDVEHIVAFILNMFFYGTPIIYALDTFSNAGVLYQLIKLNPFTYIVNAYRNVFLYHQMPGLTSIGTVFIIAVVISVFGYMIFKHLEKGFAEEL